MILKLSLENLDDWNPTSLLRLSNTLFWKSTENLIRISDQAELVTFRTEISKGNPVVKRGTVAQNGSWSAVEGDIESLGLPFNYETGLREGDLVIYPGCPVMWVGNNCAGVAFTGDFLALRPLSKLAGISLWAVLNSTPGSSFLKNTAKQSGALAPRFSPNFLEQLVPSILDMKERTQRSLQNLIEQVNELSGVSRSNSGDQINWTKKIYLKQEEDWRDLFVSPSALVKFDGTRLGDLVVSILLGRNQGELPLGLEPTVPLVNHGTVMTGEYSLAASSPDNIPVEKGMLIIPVVGEKAGAFVTDRSAVLGRGVFAIRLIDSVDPHMVQQFLLSEDGRTQRNALVRGVAIKSLNLERVAEFRIPLNFEPKAAMPADLQEAIDGILNY